MTRSGIGISKLTNEVFLVGDTYKQCFGYDIVNAITPGDLWENSLHPGDINGG